MNIENIRPLDELIALVEQCDKLVADELRSHIAYIRLQKNFNLCEHIQQRDLVRETYRFSRSTDFKPSHPLTQFIDSRIAWTLDGYPTIATKHDVPELFRIVNIKGPQPDSQDLAYYLDQELLTWLWERGGVQGEHPFQMKRKVTI